MSWKLGTILTAAAMLGVAGALLAGSGKPSAKATGTAPAGKVAASAPASGPVDANVMAYVNGQPVWMRDLYDILLRNYGLKISQQLIASEMVRQEAQKNKITVSDAEMRTESDQAMKQIFGELPADQRERSLAQFLAKFDVSREHWDMSMHRNAMLTKLAESRVKIAEAELKDEFNRQYGQKVIVRHIQTESWNEAQKVRKSLDEGADFAALAKQYSKCWSAQSGGLLPPIDPKSEFLPPIMRQVAFAMKKPGDTSQVIQAGTTFHILKLEKQIEPENVKFDDVKGKLVEALRQRQVALLKQTIPQDLFEKARKENKINFVDPILKAGYEQATEGTQP
jgi:foldase protein PrsA